MKRHCMDAFHHYLSRTDLSTRLVLTQTGSLSRHTHARAPTRTHRQTERFASSSSFYYYQYSILDFTVYCRLVQFLLVAVIASCPLVLIRTPPRACARVRVYSIALVSAICRDHSKITHTFIFKILMHRIRSTQFEHFFCLRFQTT